MSIKRIFVWLALVLAVLASGCATVPMADPAADTAAKTFTVAPGKAKIYVYRNESFGAAIKMTVFINGRELGQTVARSYLVTEVEPGAYKIQGKSENEHVLDLNAAAGRIYYVWQEVKMGMLYARNELQLVDEKTGRAGVMECSLAK